MKHTITTINRYFYDNKDKTHTVIHSKQICDKELIKVKQVYAVPTYKRGDVTFYVICKTNNIK